MQGYCMKCKKMVEIKSCEEKIVKLKKIYEGKCPDCGTLIYKDRR